MDENVHARAFAQPQPGCERDGAADPRGAGQGPEADVEAQPVAAQTQHDVEMHGNFLR